MEDTCIAVELDYTTVFIVTGKEAEKEAPQYLNKFVHAEGT